MKFCINFYIITLLLITKYNVNTNRTLLRQILFRIKDKYAFIIYLKSLELIKFLPLLKIFARQLYIFQKLQLRNCMILQNSYLYCSVSLFYIENIIIVHQLVLKYKFNYAIKRRKLYVIHIESYTHFTELTWTVQYQ